MITEERATKWRQWIKENPRDDMISPLEVEDTGEYRCIICQHLRSDLDGNDVCFLCCVYIMLKPEGKVVPTIIEREGNNG